MAPCRHIVYVAPATHPFQYLVSEHAAQHPQSPDPLTHLPPLPETPPPGAQMTHNVQDIQSFAACSETPSHPEHMQDDVPYFEQITSLTEKSASSALSRIYTFLSLQITYLLRTARSDGPAGTRSRTSRYVSCIGVSLEVNAPVMWGGLSHLYYDGLPITSTVVGGV